jgi:hypothetical protein
MVGGVIQAPTSASCSHDPRRLYGAYAPVSELLEVVD